YVVAAPSTVAGRPYRVVRACAPAELPGWLAALVSAPAAPSPSRPVAVPLSAGERHSGYLRSALAQEADHVRDAPKGRGNAVAWGAAGARGRWGRGGDLDVDPGTAVRDRAAIDRGRSRAEARAPIAPGLRRGAQRPRGVARCPAPNPRLFQPFPTPSSAPSM